MGGPTPAAVGFLATSSDLPVAICCSDEGKSHRRIGPVALSLCGKGYGIVARSVLSVGSAAWATPRLVLMVARSSTAGRSSGGVTRFPR